MKEDSIYSSIRFLLHGLILETQSGKPVTIKTHLLRYAFATETVQLQNMNIDIDIDDDAYLRSPKELQHQFDEHAEKVGVYNKVLGDTCVTDFVCPTNMQSIQISGNGLIKCTSNVKTVHLLSAFKRLTFS